MCGICGIYNFDSNEHVQSQTIQRMCDVMKHRGPDDEGKLIDKNVGIGMRRLSIIDLFTGHQPIHNEDKSIWIVYNGEIYNYLELKDSLIKKGHIFYTQSDTEVIVHLYEEFGEECVKDLCGMFAFAIWDKRERSLFLARDRFGEKPLYYRLDSKGIIFASEIKSIFEVEGVKKEISVEGLNDYFTFWYVPAPKTIFKGIKKLLPAHTLTINNGQVIEKEYWDLHFNNIEYKDEKYYLDRFEELLCKSIKERLRSDVPLGVLLSGGLDSSTVVALMSKVVPQQIKTFSIGFDVKGNKYGETNYATLVAKHFNTDHHEIIINATEVVEALPKVVWYMDEPVGDRAAVPLYYVSKLAREHVTVVLSGEGGDEILAGYDYGSGIDFYNRVKRYYKIPFFIRKKLSEYNWFRNLVQSSYIHRFLEEPNIPLSSYSQVMLEGMTNIFSHQAKQKLYSQQLLQQIKLHDSREIYKNYYEKTDATDYLNQRLYVDTKLWLANDLLMKADKMSMANSIELRIPFLDHQLVEFTATVPVELKLKRRLKGDYIGKYLLKKAMDKILPKQTIKRVKMGFSTPTDLWLREELKEFTYDTLLSSSIAQTGYFNISYIKQLLDRYYKGENLEPQIWTLLVFEVWQRNIMK